MTTAAEPGLDIESLVTNALLAGGLRSGRNVTSDAERQSRFDRLFGTPLGNRAVEAIRNEEQTLEVIGSVAAELVFEALNLQGFDGIRGVTTPSPNNNSGATRALIVPARANRPATLLLLAPGMPVNEIFHETANVAIGPDVFERIAAQLVDRDFGARPNELSAIHIDAATREVIASIFRGGAETIVQALWIARPELLVVRRPKMVRLSSPWPHIKVESNNQRSTVGIFCRDSDGDFGVTACYHGTGPVGTPATIGGVASFVKHANLVQDTVFIPIPEWASPPARRGLKGVLSKRPPAHYDKVAFHGSTSGERETRISSHDAGLLRTRPTIQLKIQTPADTNSGDSGAALINDEDQVVGFAFERTGFGEVPEITDWIWASNALTSLGLTPV